MKIYHKNSPTIMLELSQSEAEALAAIIGTCDDKTTESISNKAFNPKFGKALKTQIKKRFCFDLYFELERTLA